MKHNLAKDKKFFRCIVTNSTAYFVLAYIFVVFSYNLFSIWMSGTFFGFYGELYFHGFAMKGAPWNRDNIVIIFFFGNMITLLIGVIFNWLYRRQRKYKKSIKVFYLWVYVIAYSWFMGNFIVGALFNFGIGTALRAFRVPFFLRVLFAGISLVLLVFIGHQGQKGIKVSANLYYKRLAKSAINGFLLNQIVYPALLGTAILVIYKIPAIAEYHYFDWMVLGSILFYMIGLFVWQKNRNSITFKNRGKSENDEENDYHVKNKSCKIQLIPIAIMLIVLLAMRIGLNEPLIFFQ